MRDFEKIIAWQKAHALGLLLDDVIDWKRFRRRPGLRGQLIEAVDSIAANISEATGRRTVEDFTHFLDMAQSSARETRNHLLKARDAGCPDRRTARLLLEKLDEVNRVLYCYIGAIRRPRP